MAYFHHGTIRKYTAALLDLFNDIEVQYKQSDSTIKYKKVPLKFRSREKAKDFDSITQQQYLEGNYNVLPRASLALVALTKSEQRLTNKHNKINKVKTEDNFEFSFNSVPYEFTYELIFQCRGMNEVAHLIEQVAPVFNPMINIDIWDGINLDEPTRIPLKLLDIGWDTEEYDVISSNITTLTFSFALIGNLFSPIKNHKRIKEFIIRTNEIKDQYYSEKSLNGWDVDSSGFPVKESVIR